MGRPCSFDITCSVAPDDSEVVIPIDSTYRLIYGSQASQHATTGAYLTPGKYRGAWRKAVVSVTVKCATNDVTVTDEILTGNAGTSSDWETQGAAGSHTVTAGTTSVWEFKPLTADWRLKVLAGGTGPTTCVVRVSVTFPSSDYGD